MTNTNNFLSVYLLINDRQRFNHTIFFFFGLLLLLMYLFAISWSADMFYYIFAHCWNEIFFWAHYCIATLSWLRKTVTKCHTMRQPKRMMFKIKLAVPYTCAIPTNFHNCNVCLFAILCKLFSYRPVIFWGWFLSFSMLILSNDIFKLKNCISCYNFQYKLF